jgi:DNA-binding MarR family transcriptional regulator
VRKSLTECATLAAVNAAAASPAPEVGDLAVEAWERIRSISHHPEALAATHGVMAEAGLTLGPVKALKFLPVSGSMPMRALAARLGCDGSYVTSLVDALEEKGLAARESHPTDRRVKIIVLTAAGRRLARRVQRLSATPPPAFETLAEGELETLCALLRKLDRRDARP